MDLRTEALGIIAREVAAEWLATVVVALLALEAGLIAMGTDRLTAARALALAWGSTFVVTGLAHAVRHVRP